jgi:hypothetical protein
VAWLNLHVNTAPAIITINKNGTALFTLKVTTRDTTIYDSTLSPGKNYTYQALVTGIKSNQTTVRTMDTTSHNWSFQTFYLGGASTSILSEVAIINDNLAYAVGEVYVYGSTGGVEILPYNSAIWNGNDWELKRITVNYNGNYITPPLYGVNAYSSSNIWVSDGYPIHGDGQYWTEYPLYNMGILSWDDGSLGKIWIVDSLTNYYVGNKGTMVKFTNGTWLKMKSGTTLDIHDVYGTSSINGNKYIYYVASSYTSPDMGRLFRINGTIIDSISTPAGPDLLTVWAEPNGSLYVGGGGLWKFNSRVWSYIPLASGEVVISVRGNASNDVFAVGTFGLIAHFNGVSWKMYDGVSGATFGSVSIKGNLMIAVGELNGVAVALVGKRN